MKNQQKVWDNIAKEWHKYKKIPSNISKEFLAKQKGNILDLGGGSGRHLTNITGGKYYLLDFSKEMIKLAEDKAKKLGILGEFIVSDINKLPFENNFFDGAISVSAIHCTPKKEHLKIIKELYRVMKPGAQALIGVWNFQSKRFNQKQGKEKMIKWTDKGERYYYLFDEKEIHDLFEKVGFKILSKHNSEMMINFIVEK